MGKQPQCRPDIHSEREKCAFLSWVQLFADYSPPGLQPWTTHQAPLSMGFSRQEYWGGLPFPSPGDLPVPGGRTQALALQADSLLTDHQGSSEGNPRDPRMLPRAPTMASETQTLHLTIMWSNTADPEGLF